MDLDEFVEAFDRNPLTPIPRVLTIRPALAMVLYGLRERAETHGVEHGRTLWFDDGYITSGDEVSGEQNSVLQRAENKEFDSYIGDFHVHPYRRKMSPEASIGFSTGDIDVYLREGPSSKQSMLRLYMVVAGPKVWLIIVYPWTKAKPKGVPEGTSDVDAALEFIDSKGHTDRWFSGIREVNDAIGLEAKIGAERRMWDAIPGYPATFSMASEAMNHGLANWHGYSLFIGEFGDRGVSTSAPIVMLHSGGS